MVLPCGLTNAPATFQNYIHQALRGLLDDFCVAYLDDILILSRDLKSHIEHVGRVLDRLLRAKLHAKPSNCELIFSFRENIELLWYISCQKVYP
jgi:hypothetical protein